MKLITIYLLIHIGLICIGQDFEPIVELETGWATKKEFMYYSGKINDAPEIDKQSFYSNIVLGGTYKKFTLLTQTYTYYNHTDGDFTFSPWLAFYEIGLSYEYKFMTFGLKHDCKHLVQSMSSYNFKYGGGSNYIYVKFKIK